MTQHYQRNVVEASAWCQRCRKNTMHRIHGVKLGPCLVCLKALGDPKDTKTPEPPKQKDLFS